MTIENPRGKIISVKTKNGTVTSRIVWHTSCATRMNASASRAQRFLDNEILRRCEPYVPMDSGMLKRSGILGTIIGSGRITYIAPYARLQYYKGRKPGLATTGGLRGRYWFDRMWSDHERGIVASTAKLMGGRIR